MDLPTLWMVRLSGDAAQFIGFRGEGRWGGLRRRLLPRVRLTVKVLACVSFSAGRLPRPGIAES